MAYETPLLLTVLGNVLHVPISAIPPNLLTYMSASLSAGGTSLTVLDNNPFAINDYLVIGKPGIDRTEIVQITGAVTQGTALTVGATIYDHPTDTLVQKILWNQVELSGASTATGTKTVIATIALQPDRSDTTYVNTGTTYAFYFARFKNTQTTTFSAYSAAAPAGGYATTVIRSVKDEALAMTNEKVDGTLITDAWLNNQIFNCEQEVWSEKSQWSWAYTFNKIIGQTVTGGLSFAMPSDISDPNSDRSVLKDTVRLGGRHDLIYITKQEWDRFFFQTVYSTVASAVTIGDTVINVISVSDFTSTGGSIAIGSDSAINYTGVSVSLNQLTGVTGIAANHSVGEYVWQGQTFGEPLYYTIFGGNIYFQAGCDSTYAGLNVYMSYYRKPTAIVTDNDTLNLPDFAIYHYFLAWKILLRKNNGGATEESEALRMRYEERKMNLKRIDRTGQHETLEPVVPRISVSANDRVRPNFPYTVDF